MRAIATLQEMFSFALPSVRVVRRTEKFIKKLAVYDARSYIYFSFFII